MYISYLAIFIFLTLSNLNKTSNRAVTHTYKMHENRCVEHIDMHVRHIDMHVRTVICTCDQCDSPFCAL